MNREGDAAGSGLNGPLLAAVAAFVVAGVAAVGALVLPTVLRTSGGEQTRLDVLVTGPPFFSILALTAAVAIALLGVDRLHAWRRSRERMPRRARVRVAAAALLALGSLAGSMVMPTGHGALFALAALRLVRSQHGSGERHLAGLAIQAAGWVGLLVGMVYLLTGVGLCGPRFLIFDCDA